MNRDAVNALKRETPNDQIKKVDEPPGIKDSIVRILLKNIIEKENL